MDTSEHGIKGDPRKQAFADLPVAQQNAHIRKILGDFTEGLGSDPAENQRIMHERMGLGYLNRPKPEEKP